MQEIPATRVSLLLRLRDGQDQDAWRQFFQVYGPAVYGFARRRGLQDADAADLMQEVLRSVSGAARRLEYDPKRGTFRSWLFTITRNQLTNFLDGQRRRPAASGDPAIQERLEEAPAPEDSFFAEWERAYERQLASWAMEQIRNEFQQATWQAFWMTGVEGSSAREAGERLGMSVGAVYVAKSRVLARLREQIQQFQHE